MNIDQIMRPESFKTPTRAEITTALQLCTVVADAIRALGSVPSGELYVRVQGHFSLTQYQSIIDTLVRARLITNKNHLLTWVV